MEHEHDDDEPRDPLSGLIERLVNGQGGGEDLFVPLRDAVTEALGGLGEALRQFAGDASKAADGASDQLDGLAAAVGGSANLADAVERVMSQLGITRDSDDQVREQWESLTEGLDGFEGQDDDDEAEVDGE